MALIGRIRGKIRDSDYYFTHHVLFESLPEDNLAPDDVRNAILTGEVENTFANDERGPRYAVVGDTLDGRIIEVICRFNAMGQLAIITVYEL